MTRLTLLVPLALLLPALAPSQGKEPYKTEIQKYRAEYEADLKKDEGWLTLAGLYWLSEGDSKIGSDPSNQVVLPAGAPANVGTLSLKSGHVTFVAAEGADVTIKGKPVASQGLESDADPKPDRVRVGSVTFMIIQRGKRVGVRIWDRNNPARKGFTGCKWFPIDPAYRVKAKFTPYPKGKTIPITNVLGDTSPNPCVGYVTFKLHGRACRLQALDEDGGLFLIIHDSTTGDSTYGAGRFLDAPKPKNGEVVLDFNEATNPPCAFTPFATCPLPPKDNYLKVAIKAGEKAYHGEGKA